MTQTSKKTPKRRKLPTDILDKTDHDIAERVFGKRITKRLDELARGREIQAVIHSWITVVMEFTSSNA